jgi:hypothetical protein
VRCVAAGRRPPFQWRPAVVEDEAMSAREFRDDDEGYLAWLAAHPDGYVINIARSHNTKESRVHHAGCWTISSQNARAGACTGPYVKVCAEHLAELVQWAIDQVGEPIPPCGTCHKARDAVRPISKKRTERAVATPVPEGRCEVHGPGSRGLGRWLNPLRAPGPAPLARPPADRDQNSLSTARTARWAGAARHVFRHQA